MLKTLLVASDQSSLVALAKALEEDGGAETSWAQNGARALNLVRETGPDLVIAEENLEDMTALELIQRLIRINALINTAVVSGLPAEEFHVQSEGLGILAPLPPDPGRAEAKKLLTRLKEVMGLGQDR